MNGDNDIAVMADELSIEDRVEHVVESVLSRKLKPGRLVIRMPNRELFIPVGDIDWLEAERNNVRVHLGSRSFTVRETLTRIESRLPAEMFLRIQRSVIVNVDRVEEIRKAGHDFEVILRSGARLPLMRAYHDRLEKVLAVL